MSGPDDRAARAGERAEDEPFLSRWARLKRESRAAQSPEPPVPPAESAAVRPGPAKSVPESVSPARADDRQGVLGEGAASEGEPEGLELPPIDSLTPESEFTAFMRPGVPASLRAQALRKMFQNPKYAVIDELDPFRADFAAFTPLGDTVTAQMRYHAERLLREEMERVAESLEQGASEPAAEPAQPRAAAAASDQSASVPTEEGDERRDS